MKRLFASSSAATVVVFGFTETEEEAATPFQ